jgi:hypothetical protein
MCQSISGDQEKKCHLSDLLQGAKDIHTPPHSFLENTYLLESDEFAYAPIEQLILNQSLGYGRHAGLTAFSTD